VDYDAVASMLLHDHAARHRQARIVV
jgi:hypothetical protein